MVSRLEKSPWTIDHDDDDGGRLEMPLSWNGWYGKSFSEHGIKVFVEFSLSIVILAGHK